MQSTLTANLNLGQGWKSLGQGWKSLEQGWKSHLISTCFVPCSSTPIARA